MKARRIALVLLLLAGCAWIDPEAERREAAINHFLATLERRDGTADERMKASLEAAEECFKKGDLAVYYERAFQKGEKGERDGQTCYYFSIDEGNEDLREGIVSFGVIVNGQPERVARIEVDSLCF